MSLEDVLGNVLTEIKGLRADLKGKAPATAASTGAASGGKPDKPATNANKAPTATTNKPAPAGGKAATAGPAAGTKAPGGKHTIEQVREIIRKVAADVDKQSALDILKDDGNGTTSVKELKPEFYDAVYEACEVLLGGEGKKEAATPADDDDFA